MRLAWDLEATGFLDDSTVDYTTSPWKLKDNFKLHCAVFLDIDSGQEYTFVQEKCYTDLKQFLYDNATVLIGNNIIDYDLPVLKATIGLDYEIVDIPSLNGKPIEIVDNLILSKTLNPDRPAHSVDYFGKLLGFPKIDWRAKAVELGLITEECPQGAEFKLYHPEMLEYNKKDALISKLIYEYLLKEMGDWPWQEAVKLEHEVRHIITLQSHRGFWFDRELAESNVRELDAKMEEIRSVVEPLLPPKAMGKTKKAEYTPCKTQFLKSGEPSSHIRNFAARLGAVIERDENLGSWVFIWEGKRLTLPLPLEPLVENEPAKLSSSAPDSAHIKSFFMDLGWEPTNYKERDLTVDSKKKKINQEQYYSVVKRYVEQTLNCKFMKDRLEHLKCTKSNLERTLLGKDLSKPVKVLTNPTLTVGQDKEPCPNLAFIAEKFPHVAKISEYFTYIHRRNSILGGGLDPDDDEEEAEKGFLAQFRASDGRIPTPADTCGTGTFRYKHRGVCNVSRVSSLFGKNMRAMFGVDRKAGFLQMAFDFDSLEAKMETHAVYKYPGGVEYGVSLTAEKPNDCHSVLAREISKLLGKDFPRQSAKPVKYGCFPVDNTEILTFEGWKGFKDIRSGDSVLSMNTMTGEVGLDFVDKIWYYDKADIFIFGGHKWNVECTQDHRWFGRTKFMHVSNGDEKFFKAGEFKKNFAIKSAGNYVGGTADIKPHEAALVAWLLSDGYYKWSGKKRNKQEGLIGSISQASHKFQKEIKEVLTINNMSWEETDLGSKNENINISYRLKAKQLRVFLDRVVGERKNKHETNWVKWVLKLNVEALKCFLHNFWLADGNTKITKSLVIKQNRGNIADALMVVGNMLGYKVTQSGGKCSIINMQKNSFVGLQTGKIIPSRVSDVFCITTRSGTFIIRQKGIVTVTGNCTYNAQPARVAKTVGCSLTDGTVIFDAFWKQAAPLKMLKEKMQEYWETRGNKKFIPAIDKRKLPIRSKGNVINSYLQSAGVICAKRATVIHHKKLKSEGLIVDFWKEDWKNKSFCQQMIAYHK